MAVSAASFKNVAAGENRAASTQKLKQRTAISDEVLAVLLGDSLVLSDAGRNRLRTRLVAGWRARASEYRTSILEMEVAA